MNIDINCWHYWFYKEWVGPSKAYHVTFNDSNISLCSYFWCVVLGFFKWICFVILAIATIGGLGWFIYLFGLITFHHPYAVSMVVGTSIAVCLIVLLTQRAVIHVSNSPSLLMQYVRAKKDRVCPLVTFVDKNNPTESE
jgi:hypothetical protein